jgi:hypothetical protein
MVSYSYYKHNQADTVNTNRRDVIYDITTIMTPATMDMVLAAAIMCSYLVEDADTTFRRGENGMVMFISWAVDA